MLDYLLYYIGGFLLNEDAKAKLRRSNYNFKSSSKLMNQP